MMSNPILSSRFFKDHKPTSALYQKWREIYSWSIKCLPVYEWDGVLFVGCLQAPTDFPAQVPNTKIVFVLCDPEALKTCWHDFEGTVPFMGAGKASLPSSANLSNVVSAKASAAPVFEDVAPATEDAASENFSLSDSDHSIPEFKVDLSEEKLTSPQIKQTSATAEQISEPMTEEEPIEISEIVAEEPAAVEEAAPEGLSFEGISAGVKTEESAPEDLLVVVDEPASEGEVAASAPTEHEEHPTTEAAPEGLIFDTKFEAPKFDAEVLKTMTNIRKETVAEPAVPEASAAPAAVPTTPTPATPSTSPLSPKPAPQAKAEATSRPAASVSPLAPKPATTAAPAPAVAEGEPKKAVPTKTEIIYTKPGALSSNRELTEKQENTRTSISGIHRTANKLSEVTAGVFTEMAYHYQKSMLLLAENDQARPWKWSEQFHKQNTADVQPISFATPNPFRIVARTQKSYHGYVVPNEINDKFFEEWNEAKTPDHLTVSPILVDETLVGFLIGIGDKSADNKNSLLLCEKLATEVGVQLKRDPQLLKAA